MDSYDSVNGVFTINADDRDTISAYSISQNRIDGYQKKK